MSMLDEMCQVYNRPIANSSSKDDRRPETGSARRKRDKNARSGCIVNPNRKLTRKEMLAARRTEQLARTGARWFDLPRTDHHALSRGTMPGSRESKRRLRQIDRMFDRLAERHGNLPLIDVYMSPTPD